MEINVEKFRESLKHHHLSVVHLAKRIKVTHKACSEDTIYDWIRKGRANERLFGMAVDCINYYDNGDWKVERIKKLTVDDFRKQK